MEALPTIEEWLGDGAEADWYKPGAMMKLSAEGLRVSDLPEPSPSPSPASGAGDDAHQSAGPTPLPVLRCLYDETFCHLIGADSEDQKSMRRVYSPTLSSGGSLVRKSPEV